MSSMLTASLKAKMALLLYQLPGPLLDLLLVLLPNPLLPLLVEMVLLDPLVVASDQEPEDPVALVVLAVVLAVEVLDVTFANETGYTNNIQTRVKTNRSLLPTLALHRYQRTKS